MEIKGGKELQERYLKALQKIPELNDAALLVAGNAIINASKELTPLDTGNLRANQDARLEDKGTVSLNVRSNYALYVHENLEQKLKGQPRKRPAKGDYWDNGEPRFLAKAMQRNFEKVIEQVTEASKKSFEK